MAVIIDTKKCNGCAECVDICPVSAIKIENEKAVVNDECVGCGACVGQCPQNAIALN